MHDPSTDLGDAAHWPANVTQALRLGQGSGFAEAAFVAYLQDVRRLVRTLIGPHGIGTITNKLGYSVWCLTDRLGAPTELGVGRSS